MVSSMVYQQAIGTALFHNKANRLDGHGHSINSDGSYSIQEIFRRKYSSSIVILTDHNSLLHFDEIYRLNNGPLLTSIVLIPGIEITCQLRKSRCHVIIVGSSSKDDQLLKFMKDQKVRYFNRELHRLECIKKSNPGIRINKKEYITFCNERTPNWTITYNYLSLILKSKPLARAKMASSLDPIFEKQWWRNLPSLGHVYNLSRKINSLIFLCHLGDLMKKHNWILLEETFRKYPELLIDLSERSGHESMQPGVRSIKAAMQKITNEACLIGTDYHDNYPRPRAIGDKLKLKLIEQALNLDENSRATTFMIYPEAYIILFGLSKFRKHLILFQDMHKLSSHAWVEKYMSIRNPVKRMMAEKILGLWLLKSVKAKVFINELFSTNRNQVLLSVSKLFNKTVSDHRHKNYIKMIDCLALNDIFLRLGQYCFQSQVFSGLTKYPHNLQKGYYSNIDSDASQKALSRLWININSDKNGLFYNSKLIWRLKTINSSLNTILKVIIEKGVSRHNLSNENALKFATILLSPKNYSTETCRIAYRELIYDHLAATVILEESDYSYSEILNLFHLPNGWTIKECQYIPRSEYHYRLWLIIEINEGENKFQFELLIKKETDFYIGRAYQWKEKYCNLSVNSSPWNQNGTFNRIEALDKWAQHKSISSLLTSELKNGTQKRTGTY